MPAHEDTEEIRAALRADVPAVLRALGLGEPSAKHGDEWRFGRKGSLAVTVRGPKAGLVRNHSAEEGGDLISLIQRERGGEIRDAFDWARGHLGMAAHPVRVASSPVTFLSKWIGAGGILFCPEMAAIGNARANAGEDDPATIAAGEAKQ